MHVPAARPVTLLPETLQADVVRLLKVTVRPELAEAIRMPVPPTRRAGAAPKLIVWLTLPTVKLCVACGAGS